LWLVPAILGQEARAASDEIYVLRVDGTIVPVIADYLDRGIDEAESQDASAVVIVLNTPGGLLQPTQLIVERMIESKVPMVVYVDRWAGSAGTFMTLAAHVAAMAPASRVGAASPVSLGTGGEEQISPTMQKKITEDTAAWIRSIAKLRGRDEERAELAVREGKSYDVDEALEFRLADLKANNLEDLLSQLHGREVTLDNGEVVTISTAGKQPIEIEASLVERFLHTISDPNIASVLLTLAMIGLIAEFSNPGMIFPGVAGGISLLLAFYALGVLDANWGGILLILLAFGLFIADLFFTSGGILSGGGIASFVAGSLLLFSGRAPVFQVSPWLIALTASLIAAFFIFVVSAIIRAHQRQTTTGREGLVGQAAHAVTKLDPKGIVLVEGERWTATAEDGIVEAGERVVVSKMDRLRLTVRKAKSD
jgi:membrane-bound serine protease (ClpP class)